MEYIEPYIANHKELWDYVKKKVNDLRVNKTRLAAFSDTIFCFELNGDPLSHINELEIMPDYESADYDFCSIMEYIDHYARITINGELYGYIKDYGKAFNILSENAKSLFKTWLTTYSADIRKNTDFNLDPDNPYPFF